MRDASDWLEVSLVMTGKGGWVAILESGWLWHQVPLRNQFGRLLAGSNWDLCIKSITALVHETSDVETELCGNK